MYCVDVKESDDSMSAILKPHTGLRPMREDDLETIMSIEQDTYRYPWTRGIFQDCLHVGYSCWVYESEAGIEAYGVMSMGAGVPYFRSVLFFLPCFCRKMS